MYSLHHLTQSNTVRKELPAGLLPPRQLGFCPRSGSHWYNHKYNCLASLPAACTLGYPGIPESLYPIFSHGCQKAWFWKRWCNPSHELSLLSISKSARYLLFQREVPHSSHALWHLLHDPGSISVSFRKNRRPESDRFSFEPTLTCRLFPSSQSYQLFCDTAIQLPDKPALLSSYPTQS